MDNTLCWIWLTTRPSISLRTIGVLLETFGGVEEVYEAENYDDISGLKGSIKTALADKSLDEAEKIRERIREIGGYIVTYDSAEYPPLLKEIYSPPYVLYMKGIHPDWSRMLTITIVGTRKYSQYGKDAAEYIAGDLARRGVVIVSGMARGIDAIAGCSAIKSGAVTVAVLGSGLDVIYPSEHRGMYNAIVKNGVIITEYPPGTRPLAANFPRRNRIMAGLSRGVLVVQAPKKSGALITAAHALENGRDVFAVPANIFLSSHEGSNRLLQYGAKPVTRAEDITEEYPYIELKKEIKDTQAPKRVKEKQERAVKNRIDLEGFTELEKAAVTVLNKRGITHIDELTREMGAQSGEVNAALIMLEVKGIVKKLGSNKFELNGCL